MVATFTSNRVWWGSMHAISSYRGNRPTNKQTQTDRGDYNKLRRSFVSAQCKNDFFFIKSRTLRTSAIPRSSHLEVSGVPRVPDLTWSILRNSNTLNGTVWTKLTCWRCRLWLFWTPFPTRRLLECDHCRSWTAAPVSAGRLTSLWPRSKSF